MTLVIPASISSVALIPGTAFTARKNYNVTRCSLSRKSTKHTLSSPRFFLPLPASVRLFPELRVSFGSHNISRIHILSATGTDVAVEEPDSPVANEESNTASEIPSDTIETSKESSVKSDTSPAPAQSRRSRSVRKSEMPPVTNEELLVGATFTGKVRSIQPFGAFVDFGAFTDGLVHVSQLSDSYVKDVANVVSIGQEVIVRLLEANTETGRISLTMRQSDDSKQQQRRDAPASSDKARGARKNTSKPTQKKEEFKKSSKFVKGQDLEGTVKNLTRAGAFISLPEGEEGFLPTSEESDDGFGNMMGGSSLQAGQEISVRVLRISRGQVTLTMKKEEDVKKLDSQLNQGVVHTATNPFMLAFRKNKDVAAFLDEREKVEKAAKNPEMPKTTEEIGGMVNQSKIGSDTPEVQDQPTIGDEEMADVPLDAEEKVEDDDASLKEAHMGARTVENVLTDVASHGVVQTERLEAETSSESLAPEGSVSTASQIGEAAQPIDGIDSDGKSDGSEQIANQILNSDSPMGKEVKESLGEDDIAKDDEQIHIPIAENEISSAAPDEVVENLAEDEGKEVAENQAEDSLAKDEEQIQTPIAKNKTSSAPAEHGEEGPIPYKNGSVTSSGVQSDVPFPRETRDVGESDESSDPSGESADDQILSSESEAIVENKADDTTDEVQIQTTAAENEVPSSSPVNEENVEPALEKNGSVSNPNGESGNPAPEESVTKAAISPALVKQLREETGAGMMDCKKALSETGGDIVKAMEFLRKKGLASAEKKASRATAEGRIGSYIHDSRIGVLVEVNCETDFVSRGDIFKELVDDLAMQVAACPQVQYLVTEDVPADIVNKERDIEMQKEDLLSKPEQIRAKIVEGRIRKRLEELALLEQPYIKNDKVVIKDWVKQTIATIGENIKVKRFVRYNLGEGLEKKSQDFAAEVAAQTAAKAVSIPGKEQPATAMEANETVHKPPTVTISAAVVKQLREETGAGMMDCKKALSETGGDLVKAQEYLRKKGLSAADKKSSRLAAEGRIGSYIHDSRIGVLIEINCETDFVGRSEKFKELVDDLAMQVVACPNVQFVSIEDIPESIVKKEKDIEMQREDLLSKPENIREKIVEGRVSKRLGELVLLEQPFIKNDTLLVKDMVKQTVAALGENIKVRRFVRFTLGETIENAETETEI